MKNTDIYDNHLPWTDTSKWKFGKWYPLAVGLMSRETKEWCLNSYGVFRLDEDDKSGDIYPVISSNLSLENALSICEDHNNEKFIL